MDFNSAIKLLEKALLNREKFIAEEEKNGTQAFRLFCGVKEGIDGFVIEKYGPALVFQFHEGKCDLTESTIQEIAQWLGSATKSEAVYLKTFMQDRSHSAVGGCSDEKQCIWGKHIGDQFPILENGLKFLVRPAEGLSTGIFLDQRSHRKFLAKTPGIKRALNCFSYTCGFGVALAKEGISTTNVDISKKYLNWGKENYQANNLDLAAHSFYAQDLFEFGKLAQKKGFRYDLILLDPPSFGRGAKGRAFSIAKDLVSLIDELKELLAPGGRWFFSSNYTQWDSKKLGALVEERLEGEFKLEFEKLPPVPLDFTHERHPLSACLVHATRDSIKTENK